jgi:hypothetical protein
MKYIYRILLVIALVPAVFGVPCRASKVVAELNWLPDIIETQTQIAGYLEVAYKPVSKEKITKLKQLTDD